MGRVPLLIVLTMGIGCWGGCNGDDDQPADAGVDQNLVDTIQLPDGYKLWPCEEPGQPCNAHDECAIDPICGEDKQCYPSKFQKCNDGLDCTVDICKGMGLCEFQPKEGACALTVWIPESTGDAGSDAGSSGGKTEVRCFTKDEKHPDDGCLFCDPEQDQNSWSPANGGFCDDGDDCSKDDYCQNGVCKGVYYGGLCADEIGCTEDICDGVGGCVANTLKSDWCLINGVCYQDKQKHPSGDCMECDVSQSQSAWTTITNTCSISGQCYGVGDKHPGGCAECDPAANATGWTVKGSDCLIDNVCKVPGDQDSSNCGSCVPATDKYGWTPLPGLCKIDGVCHNTGDQHPDGCGECKPTVNATEWTLTSASHCLIGGNCYNPGDNDVLGCSTCDLQNATAWTPIPGCFNIIFAALNEAHDGNMGGIAAVDTLCAQQAVSAGFSGTFKAFLSGSTRNVKELISGTSADTVAVLNTKGEKLYNSWNEIFTVTSWPFTTIRVYSFNGTEVDEGTVSPGWDDGRGWHGSTAVGMHKSGFTCNDWSSNLAADSAASGELDWGSVYWLSGGTDTCDTKLAVICVQVAP
jgi:hypothetical protein